MTAYATIGDCGIHLFRSEKAAQRFAAGDPVAEVEAAPHVQRWPDRYTDSVLFTERDQSYPALLAAIAAADTGQ